MHEKSIVHRAGVGALVLCLCLAALIPMAQAQEPARPQERKSPGEAWGLSFVYPGLGQVYNEDWGRAVGFGVPASIGWGMYWSSWEDCVVNHTNCATRNVSAAIIMAAWIGAQIDAPRRAFAINRERSLSLEFGPAPNPLGLSLARISF
jgi:hypothetical protein